MHRQGEAEFLNSWLRLPWGSVPPTHPRVRAELGLTHKQLWKCAKCAKCRGDITQAQRGALWGWGNRHKGTGSHPSTPSQASSNILLGSWNPAPLCLLSPLPGLDPPLLTQQPTGTASPNPRGKHLERPGQRQKEQQPRHQTPQKGTAQALGTATSLTHGCATPRMGWSQDGEPSPRGRAALVGFVNPGSFRLEKPSEILQSSPEPSNAKATVSPGATSAQFINEPPSTALKVQGNLLPSAPSLQPLPTAQGRENEEGSALPTPNLPPDPARDIPIPSHTVWHLQERAEEGHQALSSPRGFDHPNPSLANQVTKRQQTPSAKPGSFIRNLLV